MIWGGYSWGNTGDELCLAAALEHATRQFGGNVAVLSPNPEHTSWLFPDTTVVPYVAPSRRVSKRWKKFLRRWGLFRDTRQSGREQQMSVESEWSQCLADARRMHLAGGGYLSDLFPLDLVLPPIQLALQLGLPVTTSPVGIGPFNSVSEAGRVGRLLRRMDLTVRDEVSRDFCQARGLKPGLAPDDAFALVKSWLPAAPEPRPCDRQRKIGVCIFRQYGQPADCDWSGWWTQCLQGLKTRHPEMAIEGFCFHASPQAEFHEMVRLFRRAGIPLDRVKPPEMDFRRATMAIREYDVVISTRFHAVVAANVFKIPNLAVASGDYYLAKMAAAQGGHRHGVLVNPAHYSPEALVELCERELAFRA